MPEVQHLVAEQGYARRVVDYIKEYAGGLKRVASSLVETKEETTVPTELPNTPPSTESVVRGKVTDAILSVTKDINTRSGGRIRTVDAFLARQMAPVIIKAARDFNVPLPYLMATIAQESRFDPKAWNPNGTDGSDPRRVDWGIGQLSGMGLMAAGVDPSRAMDYEWAIPQVARRVRTNLDWALRYGELHDVLFLAAMAYNKGRTGAEIIVTGKPRERVIGYETTIQVFKKRLAGRTHASGVMKFYRQFDKMLRGGE